MPILKKVPSVYHFINRPILKYKYIGKSTDVV